ncbi:hypothetical protein [Vreelandella sulfidaeris]
MLKNHPLADGNKRCGSFLFLWSYAATQPCWHGPLSN